VNRKAVRLWPPDDPLPVEYGTILRGGALDWTVVCMKVTFGTSPIGSGDLYRGLVIAEGGTPVKTPWLTAPQPFWPSDWRVVED
jgi:hypothetical protein